jgi:hypothetical protein
LEADVGVDAGVDSGPVAARTICLAVGSVTEMGSKMRTAVMSQRVDRIFTAVLRAVVSSGLNPILNLALNIVR